MAVLGVSVVGELKITPFNLVKPDILVLTIQGSWIRASVSCSTSRRRHSVAVAALLCCRLHWTILTLLSCVAISGVF